MKIIKWNVPACKKRIYPIYLGADVMSTLTEIISSMKNMDQCIVLYDANLKKIANTIIKALDCSGIAIPGGEHS